MNAFTLSPLLVGAAAAAVVLAVVLLYLLRPPARRQSVSSNLIWQRVLEAYRRVSDRWRWWLSLLIASVACVSIVLAVVRPGTDANAGSGKAIVVVDNAPTMATRTSSGAQRFDVAKQRAVSLIEGFPAATQVMVVDTQRRLVTPAFESRKDAVETIAGLQLGQSFQPIVPSAIAFVPAEHRYVVTDGVLLGAPPSDFVAVSVFEPANNLGITAFDFGNVPGDPSRREAFVEIFNAGNEARTTEVVISGIGEQRVAQEITVPANGVAGHAFDLSAFAGGPIRAALTATEDGYPDDDVAYGYLASRRIVRVTLVSGPGLEYLSKSLRAQPRVRLNVISPQRYMDQKVSDTGGTDIYVFDRFVPPEPPVAPSLVIAAKPASWLPARAGDASYPEILATDSRHPVLRNLSLADLYVETGNYLQPAEDRSTTVLLRGGEGRALAVAHDGAKRWVALGFDVANSNFGLLPAFPLFLGNSVNWLADEPEIVRVQPGIVAVPFADARVLAMDGAALPVTTVEDRSFFEAAQPGLYTAIGNDRPLRITVNLLDRRISNVNQSVVPTAAAPAQAGTVSAIPFGLSALLLMLVVGLLCVEWVAYHRRITV